MNSNSIYSAVEEHSLWVLNELFDLLKESDCLTTINDAMIVRQSYIHNGSRFNLAADHNWSEFRGMHAQDRTLRRVDQWCAHHGAKNASVRDGERTTDHVLQRDRAIPCLCTEVAQLIFEAHHVQVLAVAKHWHCEALWRRDGDTDVDEVAVNDVGTIDAGVHDGLVLQGNRGCLQEARHETEFDCVFLRELLTVCLSQVNVSGHIHLVEGGE